jgi:eukaryotic-like serine/threonine-protein kinase
VADQNWQRIRELFEAAVDLAAADQSRFLDAECGEDEKLRLEVEDMLRADAGATSASKIDAGAQAWLPGTRREDVIGRRIGTYTVTGHLGTGGMGTVYLAEQAEPRRTVALKMMNHGLFSDEARQRFRFEADVLASLHHPGIAQIYEVGTFAVNDQSVPFFAMEHIRDAERLDAWARSQERNVVIEQFVRICGAVHHGHQRGVIHRDLKPSNILVDAGGFAKVIDFGIARTTDDQGSRTIAGTLLGTPPYMAYEQMDARAAGPGGIDLRVDIHALGVILFELLVGKPPFDFTDTPLSDVARKMANEEMTRPSSVTCMAPELDWIVLKAAHRESEQRYTSAAELASELRRFLAGEPVLAGPPTASYRLRKFVTRNRMWVGSAAVAIVALVVGTALAVLGMMDARAAEGAARHAQKTAEREGRRAQQELETQEAVTDWLREMLLAASPSRDGREVKLTTILDRSIDTLSALEESKPHTAVLLRNVVGRTYINLGAIDKARPVLEAAVALATAKLGPDHRATLMCRDNLGVMLSESGEQEQAEAVQREVLTRRLAAFGPDDPDVASSRVNLAATLVAAHRDREALDLVRSAHAYYLRHLGPTHRSTIQALNGIGMSLQRIGDIAEAEKNLREAVRLAAAELGPEHPTTLAARNNLGGVLIARDKPAEAYAVWKDLLAAQEEVYGRDNQRVLVTVGNLVVALVNLERFAEAEPLAHRSIEGDRKAGRTIDLLVHMNSLGVIQYKQSKFGASKSTFTEIFRSARAVLPKRHWLIGQFHKCHGDGLLAGGEYGAAERQLLLGLELLEAQFKMPNRRVRKALASIVELYEKWKKPKRAKIFRDRLGG